MTVDQTNLIIILDSSTVEYDCHRKPTPLLQPGIAAPALHGATDGQDEGEMLL